MRKIAVFIVGLMLFGSSLFAAGNDEGVTGNFGLKKIWQSSETASNSDWIWMTTGAIVIGYVQVSSPGLNSSISFQQMGSTNAGMNFRYYSGSTMPAYGGGLPTIFPTTGDGIFLNLIDSGTYLSTPRGQVYTSTGSGTPLGWSFRTTGDVPAKLRILWDYIDWPR
jgi:hypothetical protein